MKNKVVNVDAALDLIRTGDTIAVASAGLVGYPEYIVKCLEERFEADKTPGNLTVYCGCGHGVKNVHSGADRFAHEGMVKRYVGSHPDVSPALRTMIERNQIEAYVFPQGVIQQLYRCSAARQPGLLTKIGMGTYIDPRQDGGKMNGVTTEDMVRLMEVDGEEYLFYKSKPVNVAIIRGTTADEAGNVTIEHEALKLEILEIALAAKASGGKVIVQAERVAAAGALHAKDVVVPGTLVDAVVAAREPDKYHMQTAGTVYSPYFSGELKRPASAAAVSPERLSGADIVCRRAAFELFRGAVVNVGIGIGAGIGPVADVEGIEPDITFTLELGVFGGTPMPRPDFGAAVNPRAFISHASMFDFYHGGGLDVTFLGAAEIDKNGNVNVSKYAGRAAGQGGFIDISQTSKKIVFCNLFKAKGMEVAVEDGKLTVSAEGAIGKFVEEVAQITFNAGQALREGHEVIYVTERAVFRYTREGMVLTEIAPGIRLKEDVLDQMGFEPVVSPELKLMDGRIFIPRKMNCFQ